LTEAPLTDTHGIGTGHSDVARLITDAIRAGSLSPGARLPTEREWVERTGQSRTAVRRALARLEADGSIIRHVGRGTFVAPAPTTDIGAPGISSPSEIMAVRLLIEPAAMPMVVTSARQSDFEEMERCLSGGENNRDYELFEQWDAAFHRSLAVATQNQLLVAIMGVLNEARDQQLWGQLKHRSFSDERCEEYIRDHRNIATAVYDRDGATAEAAMRTHLLRVRQHLLGY
jgi:DNA-binding FadR family transcriptional regulator